MSITIRPAGSGDVPAVLALWLSAEVEPSHTDDEPSLTRLIARDRGALIVADESGDVVGSVIAGWDGWRGSVYRLAVGPGHRGQGLGRRLVDSAETRLSALGATRLQAIVVGSDRRALGFWRASPWDEQTDRLRFTRG